MSKVTEFTHLLARFRRHSNARGAHLEQYWQILLLVFVLVEILFVGLVFFVSYRLEEKYTSSMPVSNTANGTPMVNREELQNLLDYFARRAATHEALLGEVPTIVDPSVRSWYREGDE
jgi:glutathione S-transferase